MPPMEARIGGQIIMTKEYNGQWALERVAQLLAETMDAFPDDFDADDRAALDVVGQIAFRIESDESYRVNNLPLKKGGE